MLPVINKTCKASGTKCSIAVGGAIDFGFKHVMDQIGGNRYFYYYYSLSLSLNTYFVLKRGSPLLKKLVDNIAKFVGDNELDGVDLDLECWWPDEGSSAADQGGRNSGNPHV